MGKIIKPDVKKTAWGTVKIVTFRVQNRMFAVFCRHAETLEGHPDEKMRVKKPNLELCTSSWSDWTKNKLHSLLPRRCWRCSILVQSNKPELRTFLVFSALQQKSNRAAWRSQTSAGSTCPCSRPCCVNGICLPVLSSRGKKVHLSVCATRACSVFDLSSAIWGNYQCDLISKSRQCC